MNDFEDRLKALFNEMFNGQNNHIADAYITQAKKLKESLEKKVDEYAKDNNLFNPGEFQIELNNIQNGVFENSFNNALKQLKTKTDEFAEVKDTTQGKQFLKQAENFRDSIIEKYKTNMKTIQEQLQQNIDNPTQKSQLLNKAKELTVQFNKDREQFGEKALLNLSTMTKNATEILKKSTDSTSIDKEKYKNLLESSAPLAKFRKGLALMNKNFAETVIRSPILSATQMLIPLMLNSGAMGITNLDPKSGLISNLLTGFLTGPLGLAMSTIKNIPNVVASLIPALNGIITSLNGLMKGFLAIPLSIISNANKLGEQIRKENNKIFNYLEKMEESYQKSSRIGKTFVQMHERLSSMRLSFDVDRDSPLSRLYDAGGDELINRIMTENDAILKAMGTRGAIMAEAVQKNATYYYSAKKLMNLADDDIKYLTNTAIALGKSFPTVFEELRKATKDAADHFNLDFKVMSKDVLTLRKDITNFAHKTSAELATVVGKISQMGVELQDAMTIFNKFQTFEDAATATSQLSQSFGMMIDSMQLLKAESPDQMLEMYRDAFLATGKSFQDMDRFNRSLLIQQTGLTEQAAQALFSAENAGKTYEELMAEADANDPTKKQLKAIEQMRDAIVELKQDLTKTFTSLFGEDGPIQQGLKNAFVMNPRLRSSFESITNALNEVYKSFSFTSQKAISEMIGPAVKLINKLAKYLKGDFLIQAKEGVAGVFQTISGYVNNQQKDIQKGFDKIMNAFRPITKFFLGIGTQVFKSILTSIIDGLPSLLQVISNTLDEIIAWTDKSTGPGIFSKFLNWLGIIPNSKEYSNLKLKLTQIADSIFGTDATDGIFSKIIKVLKNLFVNIKSEISGLFTSVLSSPDFINAITRLTYGIGQTLRSGFLDFGETNQDSISALVNALTFDSDISSTRTVQDGVINQNGSIVKIDSQDQVLAMKENGPIYKLINSSLKNQLSYDDMYRASRDGMIEALNSMKDEKPIIIKLNGEAVGEGLLASGFTAMLGNPNKTRQYPTLSSDALQYPDSQIPSNRFRNT